MLSVFVSRRDHEGRVAGLQHYGVEGSGFGDVAAVGALTEHRSIVVLVQHVDDNATARLLPILRNGSGIKYE